MTSPEFNFADLKPGDPVVHEDYGIGIFRGLVLRSIDDIEREYLMLEYAGAPSRDEFKFRGTDKLYVTLHQADRLTRYISQRREDAVCRETVQSMSIKTPGLNQVVENLSGGNQQKVVISKCLNRESDIILMDEPTRGVDVGAKAELYRLMDELCQAGIAIMLTSSELPELLTVCDRILVLCEGHLTGQVSREEATEQRIMELATQRPGVEV